MTDKPVSPDGLDDGGRALWDAVLELHTLDAVQLVQLHEACRAKDRLDKLDLLLSGDVLTWSRLVYRTRAEDYVLKVDAALSEARQLQSVLARLLAALRLPVEAGRRPVGRPLRGVPEAGSVSSLERARQAKSGA